MSHEPAVSATSAAEGASERDVEGVEQFEYLRFDGERPRNPGLLERA